MPNYEIVHKYPQRGRTENYIRFALGVKRPLQITLSVRPSLCMYVRLYQQPNLLGVLVTVYFGNILYVIDFGAKKCCD